MQCFHATVNRVRTRFPKRERSNESGNRLESSVHFVFRCGHPAKVENSQIGMSRHLDPSTTTQMA